ncbi:hypothetical protein [Calothrix sp. NIES-3974]|uniref:hypothetical protein n=1 Tax=Calothrix sp. NIES-3974 TaxID=2005462 RepID=UPI000B5EE826|nr:hypothetical protein [Calothrix sp. NIES-3974]BAZ08074.1 hypothetical protein NIES3974_47430 [Calothrix sp. NIES-3974]
MFLMNLLREEFLVFMLPFAAAFSKPVWESAIALVVGSHTNPWQTHRQRDLTSAGL